MSLLGKFVSAVRALEAPVLTQEMRIRQRGVKPFWVLLIYTLVLCIAAIITYESSMVSFSGGMQWQDLSTVGRTLFEVLSIVQLSLITLIVPAYSSASVSSERERGTLDLLSLTLLPSGAIIRQKLVAAITQVLMMIMASLPVMAVTFLLGGVSPGEVLVAYAILVSTAVLLSATGMICSCCVRSSKTSTFLAYLIPLVAFLGVPLCFAWLESMGSSGVSHAMADSPLLFTGMFALTGAIPAFAAYGFTVLVLSHRHAFWRSRIGKITVLGLTYVLLLLILTIPALESWLFSRSSFDMFGVLNPFSAIVLYIEAETHSAPGYYQRWMACISIAAFLGVAYIFERISYLKFDALRRAQ